MFGMGLRGIREWGSKKRDVASVYRIIKRESKIKLRDLVVEMEKTGLCKAELQRILASLMDEGKVYKPRPGVLECVEY